MRYLVLLSLVLLNFSAEARKFSFGSEDVAAYIKGTGGTSAVEQKAFSKSSGSTTTLSSEKPTINFGGELGVLLKVHETINFRLGVEILQAKASQIKGTDPANASSEWFELSSDIFVFNPMATVEYVWGGGPNSRFVSYFGMGLAAVRLDNKYEMTTAGQTALSQSSFTEKSEGSFISGVAGIGWEGLLVDNVTVLFDAGYRFLDVNKLKHTADNPVIGGSNAAKGSEVMNNDGSRRQFDLGGPFVGLSFRFYIDVI